MKNFKDYKFGSFIREMFFEFNNKQYHKKNTVMCTQVTDGSKYSFFYNLPKEDVYPYRIMNEEVYVILKDEHEEINVKNSLLHSFQKDKLMDRLATMTADFYRNNKDIKVYKINIIEETVCDMEDIRECYKKHIRETFIKNNATRPGNVIRFFMEEKNKNKTIANIKRKRGFDISQDLINNDENYSLPYGIISENSKENLQYYLMTLVLGEDIKNFSYNMYRLNDDNRIEYVSKD